MVGDVHKSPTYNFSIAMANFDVVTYLSSLVTYPLPKESIQRIAVERGVISVTDWTEIDRRTRNLCFADILMLMFTAPSNTGSKSKSHGDFSCTIGGVILTDKNDVFALMMRLYKNPDLELWEALDNLGECSFIDVL